MNPFKMETQYIYCIYEQEFFDITIKGLYNSAEKIIHHYKDTNLENMYVMISKVNQEQVLEIYELKNFIDNKGEMTND